MFFYSFIIRNDEKMFKLGLPLERPNRITAADCGIIATRDQVLSIIMYLTLGWICK